MRIRLTVRLTPNQSFAFEHAGPSLGIGRDPGCELPLQGDAVQAVSWEHARIDLSKQGAVLTDLGSTNGTFLNGRPVQPRMLLRAGDEVQFGRTGPQLRVDALELTEQSPVVRRAAPAPAHPTVQEGAMPPPPIPRAPAASAGPEPHVTAMVVPPPPPANIWESMGRLRLTWVILAGVTAGLILAVLVASVLLVLRARPVQQEASPAPDRETSLPERPAPAPKAGPPKDGSPPAAPPEPSVPVDAPPPTVANPPSDEAGIASVPSKKGSTKPLSPPRKPRPPKAGEPVGKIVAAAEDWPDLLLRKGTNGPWQPAAVDTPLAGNEALLSLPGFRSGLSLGDGVSVQLWGHLAEFAETARPLFVQECFVRVGAPVSEDAKLVLERGLVVLTNQIADGEATIALQLGNGPSWVVTLLGKGSEVVVRRYGVAASGALVEAGAHPEPAFQVDALCTKGRARIQAREEVDLAEGVQLRWNSKVVEMNEVGPVRPPWWPAPPVQAPEYVAMKQALQGLKSRLDMEGSLQASFVKVVPTGGPVGLLALRALAALEETSVLAALLEEASTAALLPEVIEQLRLGLAHYPDSDKRFLAAAAAAKRYTPDRAGLLVRLLHGPDVEMERKRPETYQFLIALLRDESLTVRLLANDGLLQLVEKPPFPIDYQLAGPAAAREEAFRRWKQHVPDGKVPPEAQ